MDNIDWDDIELCSSCENNFDIAELHEVDGDMVCENCMNKYTAD